jgi:hypothetical protein
VSLEMEARDDGGIAGPHASRASAGVRGPPLVHARERARLTNDYALSPVAGASL